MTRLRAGRPKDRDSIPDGSRDFLFTHNSYVAHPVDTGGLFPGR
jgi:hypothetical protein